MWFRPVTSQLCNSLVVHPLLKKTLDTPLIRLPSVLETAVSENFFEASSSQECQLTWDNRGREVFRKLERESGRGKVFPGISEIGRNTEMNCVIICIMTSLER